MKLKILYAVLLLGSIKQLYGSYYLNRLNFGRLYRSQCATNLCKDSHIAGIWGLCMQKYKFSNENLIRYFQRDCYSIGGHPWIIYLGNKMSNGHCYRPKDGLGDFNKFVCGFRQNFLP
jgi:hypothetical protein